MGTFTTRTRIPTSSGDFTILDNIGSGREAEVFRAEYKNKPCAFKYFFKEFSNEATRDRILDLINNFSESEAFVLPFLFVEYEGRYGYLMEYVDRDKYHSIAELYNSDKTCDPKMIALCCLRLCQAFDDLSSAGYNYKDISSKNIALNIDNGKIKIFDTSNITPSNKCAAVNGTPSYMAPELLENKKAPTTRYSDYYSLAIILFELFLNHGPFESEKNKLSLTQFQNSETAVDELYKTQYGYEAKFILRNADDIDQEFNKVDDGFKTSWNNLPIYIRELFVKCFTDGVKDQDARPSAHIWLTAMITYYQSFYKKHYCPRCGNEIYPLFDFDSYKQYHDEIRCDSCFEKFDYPILKITDQNRTRYIVLYDGREIESMLFSSDNDIFEPVLNTIIDKNGLKFVILAPNYQIKYGDSFVFSGDETSYISPEATDFQLLINNGNQKYQLSVIFPK